MDDSPLIRERIEKLAAWRADGIEPYPWSFPGRRPTSEARQRAERLGAGEADAGPPVRVAGRLRAVRVHGRTAFFDLEDAAGRLQLIVRSDEVGTDRFDGWVRRFDPGDLLGADGRPARSKRGELSLDVTELTLLAKAIAPPPEKFHGLQDAEERLRRRYVDLLASPDVRARFRLRARLERAMRAYFDDHDFLGVETPVLLPVASGAAAAPFLTHSNWLDETLQLRIALELPLKRLLVGGLERVYEVGPCFRNEDADTTHHPEFTMVEAYWAYADYHDMRGLIEGLFSRLAEVAADGAPPSSPAAQAAEAFRPPFRTIDFVEALEERSGLSSVPELSIEALRAEVARFDPSVPSDAPVGKLLDRLFAQYVEPTLDAPTFVVDHPLATTPLAKAHRSKPGRVERFELFYRRFELANAYTELNDPIEQERRFREQLSGRPDDRYAYDADFLEALRYGLPPSTGVGFGLDRIALAFTGAASIKDVILFPQVRRR